MTRTQFFRLLPLLGALALFATTWSMPASAHGVRQNHSVAASQATAALVTDHQAYSKPDDTSKKLDNVSATRPITDEQTVLPVLETQGSWLKVRLPGRPNSHTGWIESDQTVAGTTPWHVVVKTATRRVLVYKDGHVVKDFLAIVGKPSTPTPHGEFFVEESVLLAATDPGAPYALALSARSKVLQEFAGGPGQIALHGINNIGGTLGTAESHGCVRLATKSIRWLALHIDPGVPVTITR